MKRVLQNITLMALVMGSVTAFAQTRYKDKLFTSVTVQENITYGENYQVLTGTPTLIPLQMDVYTPSGDNVTDRPLIIYLHTGSFLPPIVNGSPSGSRKDSATAEMCREFARRGYVAASVSYRLGWNPQGDQATRTGTILNAVYRAMQDAKTAIRYFRKETATNGNPFGIDTTKIVIVGQGTGGYAGLAAAYLDKNAELNLLKFIDPNTNASYVNQAIVGDFDGFGGAVGVANNPNWAGYSSDFNMVVNLGGAIGDTSWMEAGDMPTIAFQSVTDPFAPYNNGTVLVPGTTFQVIDVSGSGAFTRTALRLGLQTPMYNPSLSDPISNKANSINGGVDGLYPLYIAPFTPQAGPWEWWDSTIVKTITINPGGFSGEVAHRNSMMTNPNMSKTKALSYIDTIQQYIAPRIMNVLQLPGNTVSVNTLEEDLSLSVYPNPAQDEFFVRIGAEHKLKSVRIYDIIGKEVRNIGRIEGNEVRIERQDLTAGIYFVSIETNLGVVTKKINLK